MGCSATKNLSVEPLEGNGTIGAQNGTERASPRRISNVPPLEGDDPQTEVLENINVQQASNGLSFEIAFDNEEENSIIRKHPPKRFQRLEEQLMSPTLTLEKLQEKLEEADIRRQQILQQRIQSAKMRNILKKQDSVASIDDPNHLKIPQLENAYNVSFI